MLSYDSGPDRPVLIAESDQLRVFAVRWTVAVGIDAEGLPDADQTPETIAGLKEQSSVPFARRLAEAGCRVLVPTLLDRQCLWSGNPEIAMTDQTHREWIWRHSVEFGRHPIGYEVRQIEAAVSWLKSHSPTPVGVVGYGEGGLLAQGATGSTVGERLTSSITTWMAKALAALAPSGSDGHSSPEPVLNEDTALSVPVG